MAIDPTEPAEPATAFERWRRRSATGVVFTAVALGLQEALEPEKEKPAIVLPAPMDPLGPVEVFLDPDSPEATWVIVRPWLLNDGS